MSQPERKNYPQLGEVKAPYVHAVKHGDTLYVSGLTAFGTPAQKGGIAEQAEAIFKQLHQITAAEGISLASLLKVTIFVTSLKEIDSLRNVLFHHFAEHLPASSLVEVSGLFSADLCVEIETIFAL